MVVKCFVLRLLATTVHHAFHALCNTNNKIKDDLPTPTEIVNTEQPLSFETEEGRWRNKFSKEYKLHFDRKINETCYSDFPLSVTHDNTTQSLLIIDRHEVKFGRSIPYKSTPPIFVPIRGKRKKNFVSFKMQYLR